MANELNLALVAAGFTTIGGMVYGSYELLKNEPTEVTKLMELKKRVMLEEKDTELWNQNWEKYVEEHTDTVEDNSQPTPEVLEGTKPQPKPTKKVVNTKDDWGLLKNWDEKTSKKDLAPPEFKNKCNDVRGGEQNGIWTTEYKRFERYCTKADTSED